MKQGQTLFDITNSILSGMKTVLEAEQPEAYVGMPVPLLGLMRACGKKSLQRALISGDACPESVLRSCEEILGSKLFPHYGSREMGMAGAVTCPAHCGMHLRENHIIAEIVSPEGKPLSAGETGELVITTIGMEAMPLIRYRTGDYTRILPSPCLCGSETVRLDRVQRYGSSADMYSIDDAVFSLPDVVDCKAFRKENGILLRLLTTKKADAHLVASAAEALFPEQQISVSARGVSPSDTAQYPGKRVLLPI